MQGAMKFKRTLNDVDSYLSCCLHCVTKKMNLTYLIAINSFITLFELQSYAFLCN